MIRLLAICRPFSKALFPLGTRITFLNTPRYLSLISRLYSEQVAPSKTLKPSSFALPKDLPVNDNAKQLENDPLRDFHLTKIVHGHTDLKIGITDQARNKLALIANDDNNPDSALRIQVESGGCHGFQYNLELTSMKTELAKDDDLVVFERSDEPRARVIFDDSSLEILQDSKVDYTKELIGSSFKVVDSPYTSTACGCGASFDFDFEKLERAKSEKSQG